MSGTGIDVVPNLPKCPVPVLMLCRTYRIEVSGTGIDVVPNIPKCPAPVPKCPAPVWKCEGCPSSIRW